MHGKGFNADARVVAGRFAENLDRMTTRHGQRKWTAVPEVATKS